MAPEIWEPQATLALQGPQRLGLDTVAHMLETTWARRLARLEDFPTPQMPVLTT